MYYNQNNYAHVPYPAPGYESATVKSGGCGPCCASMIVEGLTGLSFSPEKSAAFSIVSGARVSGGTDMRKLSGAIQSEYGVRYSTTSDPVALASHLKAGGWAAANVGGDRTGYIGLFSSGGHYVVAKEVTADGRLIVWDPNNYSGKFAKAGRKGRVELSGNDIYVEPAELQKDCQSRSPAYYLFTNPAKEVVKMDDAPSSWAKDAWEKAIKLGVTDGTSPKASATREQLIVILDRLGMLK